MTLNKLASEIAKREGKKSQARIGDIREVLKILVDIECEKHLTDEAPSFIIEQAGSKKFVKQIETAKKMLKKQKPIKND